MSPSSSSPSMAMGSISVLSVTVGVCSLRPPSPDHLPNVYGIPIRHIYPPLRSWKCQMALSWPPWQLERPRQTLQASQGPWAASSIGGFTNSAQFTLGADSSVLWGVLCIAGHLTTFSSDLGALLTRRQQQPWPLPAVPVSKVSLTWGAKSPPEPLF